MLSSIRRVMRGLGISTSGNAAILVAAGLPALIGASGLAVDSAQYYMWKRELQFAVDQAALAGAWAKTDTSSAANYSARALQEYNTNMQIAGSFDTAPTVTTVNYNGGTSNAVRVVSSATKALPFTNIVIGRGVTVSVEATAVFAAGVAGTSTTTTVQGVSACMVALHPTANGALTIGGTASGTVSCGGATLSADANGAIRENGNPNAQFGTLAATGGIEATLLDNVGNNPANLRPNQSGLTNPFASIATPTGSGVAKTYSCPVASGGTTTYTVDGKRVNTPTYRYFSGATSAAATEVLNYASTEPGYLANPVETDVSGGSFSARSVASSPAPTTGNQTTTATAWATVSGQDYVQVVAPTYKANGSLKTPGIWRRLYTRQIDKYTLINPTVVGGSDGIARPQPGTYTNISIGCETRFDPGIYVITGAMDFSTNKTVTGTDVMFVLTSPSSMANINSNSSITLSGITASRLTTTYGYSSANATKLAGMLFWDPLGTTQIKWNGNSVSILNGTMYMPNRPLWFNGTAAVSGRCMMLIASTLMFTGTIDLNSFCQTGGASNFSLRPTTTTTTTTVGTAATVKLVV